MTHSHPHLHDGPAPELSRIVNCAELGTHVHREHIVASAAECAALAKRFDLLSVDRLRAEITVSRQAGALVRVEGRLEAAYRQACVVTLEPIETEVAEPFTLLYSPRPDAAATGEIVLEPDAEDWPEPILADRIDLGEAVAQQLALTIDPYPRKAGAALPASAAAAPDRADGPASAPVATIKSLMEKAFQEAGRKPAKKR